MFKSLKILKRLLLVLSFLVLLPSNVYSSDICLPEEQMEEIVQRLESLELIKQELAVQQQITEEMEKQVQLLKETNQLQKDQINISKETIKSMEDISKQKDLACDQKVKDAKPSFWSTVTQYGIFTAIGVVIGALLL